MCSASGDGVYKLDYNKVLEYHIEKKADITVVCKDMPKGEDVTRFGVLKMNEDCRIEEFEEKPMGVLLLQHRFHRDLCHTKKAVELSWWSAVPRRIGMIL